MVLPVFGHVSVHTRPLSGGVAHEADWLADAAVLRQPVAHLWSAPLGVVVPRRYAALPGWAGLERAEGHGEVQVRASGGGLVPQGPGVWNLSLAWPAPQAGPSAADEIYRALCAALATAFARLGLRAEAQAVNGSFCDGRYNLAVAGRKLVGTAQAWRRVDGLPMVLVHAVIVVNADPQSLTARANAFEAALGTPTRYRADALTSVALARDAQGQGRRHGGEVESSTLTALAEQFARLAPPRAPHTKEISDGAA